MNTKFFTIVLMCILLFSITACSPTKPVQTAALGGHITNPQGIAPEIIYYNVNIITMESNRNIARNRSTSSVGGSF